jgi:hypothetical protein
MPRHEEKKEMPDRRRDGERRAEEHRASREMIGQHRLGDAKVIRHKKHL